MYTLAINPCVGELGSHDPSAVVFEDGELLFGVEEERFVRDKHATNTFPERAVEACLDHAGVELRDVEKVLVPWKPSLFPKMLRYNVEQSLTQPEGVAGKAKWTAWSLRNAAVPPLFGESVVEQRLRDVGTPVPPIETREHHECHAASAFYPTDFDEALVLTLDGRGEYDSTVVWHGTQRGLRRLRTYEYPNSLGFFFGAVTKFLGYYPNNGEGKIMGLAPYGNENADIEDALRSLVDVGVDYDVTALSRGNFEYGTKQLEDLFDRPRKTHTNEFSQWEKDLAYVTQQLLEETVVDIVETFAERLGVHDVGLAGGVALNCKMNKRVMELDAVDNVFVQPVSNDAGSAVGAGMLDAGPRATPTMNTVYWGPSYSDEQITARLETNKIPYTEPDDIERVVAERIADGDLVGWFQGRLEMGPRALGNRSILADPRSVESLNRVNEFVKHREGWRPFAPSMTEDGAEEYLVDAERSPYMIKTFDVKPGKESDIPAVLHPADETTRPQTVDAEQNPRYHRLLTEFERITGVPVLLNTSFNDHGEPIVNNDVEAIKDFYGMGLDLLVLGDKLVEKGERPTLSGGVQRAPSQSGGS
jgi:carbamoyltransferase